MLARVTKTATMDAADRLAAGIEDLRRRCDAAGRDSATIDITFNGLRGTPGTAEFRADAYLSELERLAGLGVTAVQLSVPGDALQHALAAIEEFASRSSASSHASVSWAGRGLPMSSGDKGGLGVEVFHDAGAAVFGA